MAKFVPRDRAALLGDELLRKHRGLDEDQVRRYIREQEKRDGGQNTLFNEHQ